MAFTTTALLVGGLAAGGIGEVIQGISKSPKQPDQPALPNQTTADNTAASTVANQRQTLLAAGGQTDYTDGLGVLTGSDVSKSTLVGG